MLPLKESNRLSYVFPLWLNIPDNYIITLSGGTWSQPHFFQIDRRKAEEIAHRL